MAINTYRDCLVPIWYTNSQGQKKSVERPNEQYKIAKNKITLYEIPDEFYKINNITLGSTPLYEINYGGIPDVNEFVVNYTLGEITFNPANEAQTITIPSWYSRGIMYWPASRVYDELNPDGSVSTTLADYISSIRPYQFKGVYDNSITYINNNQVYYEGSTYICISLISLGHLPTDSNFWRMLSAGYGDKGAYDNGVQYYVRDVVEYNYALYLCIQKPPIGTLPTNTTYFDKLLSVENVQTLVNETKHKGDYNPSTQYYQNNIISFNGCSFMAKVNTIGNSPPLLPIYENTYWALIGMRGNDGAALTFKGAYNNSTSYSKDDLVYYNDGTNVGVYAATQTTIGHFPTDTTYWSVFMTGGGNMNTVVYDIENTGIVDDSKKLGGQLPSYYTIQSDFDSHLSDIERGRVSVFKWIDKVVDLGLSTEDWSNAFLWASNYIKSFDNPPDLIFPAGDYKYSVSPNWACSNARILSEGLVKFIYTGTDIAVIINGTPTVTNMEMGKFWVFAPPTSKDGYYINLCHHSKFNLIVQGCGNIAFNIGFNVCTEFGLKASINEISPNGWYMNAKPVIGLYLDEYDAHPPSCNIFYNPIIEGCSNGITLKHADSNSFFGGTSEQNTGFGLNLYDTATGNKFYGMDFEQNTTADIYCTGAANVFTNCDSDGVVTFAEFATANQVVGGYYSEINLTGNSHGSVIDKVHYNRNNNNKLITDNGVYNRLINNYNVGLNLIENRPKVYFQEITVTGSPFTYQNTTGNDEQIIVRGGTISFMTLTHVGAFEITNMINTFIRLCPGDSITVTYSVAPDIFKFTT